MPVKVHIPTPMRQHTDGQATVDIAGANVKEVLDNLGSKHTGITNRLFEAGKLRQFINIYLNDEDIRYLDEMQTAVTDGVIVALIPAVAGG